MLRIQGITTKCLVAGAHQVSLLFVKEKLYPKSMTVSGVRHVLTGCNITVDPYVAAILLPHIRLLHHKSVDTETPLIEYPCSDNGISPKVIGQEKHSRHPVCAGLRRI